MSNYIMLFLILCGSLAAELTTQQMLPVPFSQFENLYFDVDHSTFISNNCDVNPHAAISPAHDREYSLEINTDFSEKTALLKGTTLFLFETTNTSSYLTHFFHLLEHVVGIWSFYGVDNYNDVRLIVMTADYNWAGPNFINKHLLKALFPKAEVKTWEAFIWENRGKYLRMERAVTSDRAISANSRACAKINKMLGAALHCLSSSALNQLALQVNSYANTPMRNSDRVAVTYLTRHMPRALEPELEHQFVSALQALPGVQLRVVNFAGISFKEQINIIGNTDVLISVHGNGLSHLLFLPQSSTVVEILPDDAYTVDYRLFADARGMDYLGINNHGVIDQFEAYNNGMRGNINATIKSLDFDPIIAKINERNRN